jgi:hypothetical protein
LYDLLQPALGHLNGLGTAAAAAAAEEAEEDDAEAFDLALRCEDGGIRNKVDEVEVLVEAG